MEQQIEEAAYNYSQCQHPISFEEQKMHAKGFLAGANWQKNQTKWIPVEESLPKKGDACLFKVRSNDDWYNGKVYGGTYTGYGEHFKYEFSIPGHGFVASHWCPIPKSLLGYNETE